MDRHHLTLVRAVAVAAAACASTAVVADAASRVPREPSSGRWLVTQIERGDAQFTGGFRISHGVLTGFAGRIGPAAETACGTGRVSVTTRLKLKDASGETDEGGTYNEWAVGRNTPDADPVISPVAVTVIHNGHRTRGSMYITWVSPGEEGSSGGELYYDGQNCDMAFLVKHV